MHRITTRQATPRSLLSSTSSSRVAAFLPPHNLALPDDARPQVATTPGARGYGQAYIKQSTGADESFLSSLRQNSTVKEQLRQWEREHPQLSTYTVAASLLVGQIPNVMFKSQALSGMREGRQHNDEDEPGAAPPSDAVLKHLQPGTLIERRLSDSRIPLLAVMLGRYHGVYYYLSNGGQLMADDGIPPVLFAVQNFASPAEIRPLVDFLPKDRYVSPTIVDQSHQPPVELTAALHTKMNDFTAKANHFYLSNMGVFSTADTVLTHPTDFTTLTLSQIARALLPGRARKGNNYDPALLYALHTGLLNDDTSSFRPMNDISGTMHASHLYRISPRSSIETIRKVQREVREIMEALGQRSLKKGMVAVPNNGLWKFILKARRVVKESRAARNWTDYGILAPHSQPYKVFKDWTEEEKQYLGFLEYWIGKHVPRDSTIHTTGAAMIRLTHLYRPAKELSIPLAWVFLQELGRVPSWELPTRYSSPIPGARVEPGGGYIRPSAMPYSESLKEDVARDYREDLGRLTAYCIDDPSTTLLDDAVSIEAADTPGEYWVNTHVADPTAFIKHDSKLADFAAIMASDHFSPGYRISMFPEDFYDNYIMKKLSLAEGRPCLTISTRLNKEGKVLDIRIRPGTLGKVVFLSPDDVNGLCPPTSTAQVPENSPRLTVGIPQQQDESAPTRQMDTVAGLTAPQKAELQTMHQLLRAVDDTRKARGATAYVRPAIKVRVMFDGVGSPNPARSADTWSGDPAIDVSYQADFQVDLVSMAMTLAGESGAKWCHARGVPIPYLTQPGALRNPALLRAMSEEIRKLQARGEEVLAATWKAFDMECGPTQEDTTPSPILPLGLEMYTRITSPLRRLSDCLVHWQIHAALAREHNRSSSSASPVSPALPWDHKSLKAKLEELRLSIFISRSQGRRAGEKAWMYQAILRAAHFGEAELPRTMRFNVSATYRNGVVGELDYFGMPAVVERADMHGVALMKDVCIGDVFEVEIKEVNSYSRRITAKALRVLFQAPRTEEGVAQAEARPLLASEGVGA